jgi:hypothetical protein
LRDTSIKAGFPRKKINCATAIVASRGQLNYLKFFLVLQDEADDLVPVYAELNLALPWGGPALRARIFLSPPARYRRMQQAKRKRLCRIRGIGASRFQWRTRFSFIEQRFLAQDSPQLQ